jgi:hypothetical protein
LALWLLFFWWTFCGTRYLIYRDTQGGFHYSGEELLKDKKVFKYDFNKRNLLEQFTPKDTNINKLLNCPVVLRNPAGEIINNPRLTDIHFQSFMTATDCYQTIYNWLSANLPEVKIPNSPDDMHRYQAKGFDKKTSFRNIK